MLEEEGLRRVTRDIMSMLSVAMWSIGQWPHTLFSCPPQSECLPSTGGDLDWVCLVSGQEEMTLARAVEQEARAWWAQACESARRTWRA